MKSQRKIMIFRKRGKKKRGHSRPSVPISRQKDKALIVDPLFYFLLLRVKLRLDLRKKFFQ